MRLKGNSLLPSPAMLAFFHPTGVHSIATRARIFATFILLSFTAAAALAQIAPLSSDIMRPIPGAGHDYVKGLSETVNPAKWQP